MLCGTSTIRYGTNGAYYCKKCKTVFKAIREKRTGRLKLGKIVRREENESSGSGLEGSKSSDRVQ